MQIGLDAPMAFEEEILEVHSIVRMLIFLKSVLLHLEPGDPISRAMFLSLSTLIQLIGCSSKCLTIFKQIHIVKILKNRENS